MDQLERLMKECGFWQRYDLDSIPKLVNSYARMHYFCMDSKHKFDNKNSSGIIKAIKDGNKK